MDTTNIIALVLGGTGFVISIVGLVATPILNLNSKRLEKRLEYRFQLFQKILELREFISKPTNEHDINPLMSDINKLIQLYGYNHEIKSFRELNDSYYYYDQNINETNKEKFKAKLSDFFSISFNAYRKEIFLDKWKEV